jgi:hypothetical protein
MTRLQRRRCDFIRKPRDHRARIPRERQALSLGGRLCGDAGDLPDKVGVFHHYRRRGRRFDGIHASHDSLSEQVR